MNYLLFRLRNLSELKVITTMKSRKLSVQEEWMQTAVQLGIRGIRKEFVNQIKNYVPENATTEAWNLDQNFDKNRFHIFFNE